MHTLTIVQEQVILHSPVSCRCTLFRACGDRVIITDDAILRRDDYSPEEAHLLFNELFDRGWR